MPKYGTVSQVLLQLVFSNRWRSSGVPSRPVVVVEVVGISCRALLDTASGSSYAPAALISKLNRKPVRSELKRIEMMMTWTNQKKEMYKVRVSNIKGVVSLPTTLSKVDKGTLLTIPNPRYVDIISKYQHLKSVEIGDTDIKPARAAYTRDTGD